MNYSCTLTYDMLVLVTCTDFIYKIGIKHDIIKTYEFSLQ